MRAEDGDRAGRLALEASDDGELRPRVCEFGHGDIASVRGNL